MRTPLQSRLVEMFVQKQEEIYKFLRELEEIGPDAVKTYDFKFFLQVEIIQSNFLAVYVSKPQVKNERMLIAFWSADVIPNKSIGIEKFLDRIEDPEIKKRFLFNLDLFT